MNSEIPLNTPSSASNYQDSFAPQAPVLSVKDWLIMFVISIIPVVNIIMLFVWAFGGNANPNKSNYSKASLIMVAISIVLSIAFIVLIFVIFGASMSNGMFDNYQ